MNATIKLDDSKAKRKIRRVRRTFPERMQATGELAARRTAFFAMRSTLPFSGDDPWPFKKMEGRIESDVEAGYFTKDDDGWEPKAYDLIKEHKGEKAAKRFWNAYKKRESDHFDPDDPSGVLVYERAFDRMRGIPRKADLPAYQKLRDKHGRTGMGKGVKPLGVLTSTNRKAFLKRRKKTMGLAKAGWLAVARGFGKREKFKIPKSGDARFVWPKELRTPFRLFGGLSLGAATVVGSKDGYKFRIRNLVNYADEAMPRKLYNLALSLGRKEMIHQLKMQKRHFWKGVGQ